MPVGQYRICWQDKATGAGGRTMWKDGPREEFQQAADEMNESWPEIHHWVEPLDIPEPLEDDPPPLQY